MSSSKKASKKAPKNPDVGAVFAAKSSSVSFSNIAPKPIDTKQQEPEKTQ